MIRKKLEVKYGKYLIGKVFKGGYLNGCTVSMNKDGSHDFPESDIILAIRQIRGQKISPLEWD